MHAIVGRSLLSPRSALRACRFVAGRRFALPSHRPFQSTALRLQKNDGGAKEDVTAPKAAEAQPTTASEPISAEQEEVTRSSDQPPDPPDQNDPTFTFPLQEVGSGKPTKGPYGSAKRRMRRNVARLESVITAPPQYLQNNIRLYQPFSEEESAQKEVNGGNASGRPDEEVYPNATVGGGAYQIHRDVLFEVQASVSAGLRPAWAGEADSIAAAKPHLVLQSPKEGGSAFLDAVVDNAAKRCRADVVTLDAQDIAEFVADHNTMNATPYTTGTLRTLGYDTHVVPPHEQSKEPEEDGEDAFDDVEIDTMHSRSGTGKSKGSSYLGQPMIVSSLSGNVNDIFKSLGFKTAGQSARSEDQAQGVDSQSGRPFSAPPDQTVVAKLIESLLNETDLQRQARAHKTAQAATPSQDSTSAKEDSKPAENNAPPTSVSTTPPPAEDSARSIILHIKDYLEIYSTAAGSSLLRSVHDLVLARRKSGQNVLLLGTSSSEDLLPTYTKDGWKDVQNEVTSGPYRTIIVPCTSPEVDDVFRSDENIRVRDINIRHLQDMLRRLTFSPELTDNICRSGNLQLESSSMFTAGLSEEVWSFEHMQRLTNTALGLLRRDEEMTAEHIEWALNMISSSDSAKGDWLAKDKKQHASPASTTTLDSKEVQEERLKKLRKQCNTHEKKLLNGVIDPANISTTFGDVRAPATTKDALQNLTSLSLTRPEAFTYGVLAQEKIPGLLLYGPPGTGKTLLAKAVAKESGATVLEVSGSDVYDMYVGEGEKNVRAIFSLAKKIAPCVVFIDEADAIFGQRSNGGSRTTHREIINQFLREWDGMNEKSAFIMVATNRPFDLDDAVMRRLPRRLLVDLPTEKDREEILKIHLKGELLAEDVAFSQLAQKTPFYSGSDLKNICVAAALACVREETDAAIKHASETVSALTGDDTAKSPTEDSTKDAETQTPLEASATEQSQATKEPYKYPERRTLRNDHFEKALSEISASISDDMSSLTAIRRFDEKYGDRKGRRKKAGGPGFGTVTEKEREKLEDGRVRTEQ